MNRQIEVWFTALRGRESKDAKNLRQAKTICAGLSAKGFGGIVVDITFYSTDNGDLIENKSKWYSFDNGKLKAI